MFLLGFEEDYEGDVRCGLEKVVLTEDEDENDDDEEDEEDIRPSRRRHKPIIDYSC